VERVLSIDIGSTWTKAGIFDLGAPGPRVLGQAQTPTTQKDLFDGFRTVVRSLQGQAGTDIPLRVSSSAKGGLGIVAIGIVPDLTVSIARMAAASAGGRIAASFSYRLARQDIAGLEEMHPDIILLCGGTDGGNESYLLQNARSLAVSGVKADIIYAGNAALQEEVSRILAGKPARIVKNVMPEVGRLDIEPARAAIRDLYLQHIVEGKGLGRIRDACASDPLPTPLAVYGLLEACAAADGQACAWPGAAPNPSAGPAWTDMLLIDMGGATTDVYSLCPAFRAEEGTVLRGLEEPALKRTVEGDLGMRVSARAAAETGAAYIAARLGEAGASAGGFQGWVRKVAALPETLPGTKDEQLFDDILAEACLSHALQRHAGTVEEVWTPGGKVRVQRGKDLRGVRRIVASGGWLARRGSSAPLERALAAARRDTGGASLLPVSPVILSDDHSLVPLLGNIAHFDPSAAVRLAADCLSPERVHGG
jgi:uncharacterized protein (TIGR01319 family)